MDIYSDPPYWGNLFCEVTSGAELVTLTHCSSRNTALAHVSDACVNPGTPQPSFALGTLEPGALYACSAFKQQNYQGVTTREAGGTQWTMKRTLVERMGEEARGQ